MKTNISYLSIKMSNHSYLNLLQSHSTETGPAKIVYDLLVIKSSSQFLSWLLSV